MDDSRATLIAQRRMIIRDPADRLSRWTHPLCWHCAYGKEYHATKTRKCPYDLTRFVHYYSEGELLRTFDTNAIIEYRIWCKDPREKEYRRVISGDLPYLRSTP